VLKSELSRASGPRGELVADLGRSKHRVFDVRRSRGESKSGQHGMVSKGSRRCRAEEKSSA
jgi:hypothetical protein